MLNCKKLINNFGKSMAETKKSYKFSPLVFLASLGAGGIAVMPFAFLQYTLEHGPGLVARSDLAREAMTSLELAWFSGLEAVMIVFATIHFVLTAVFLRKLWQWLKTDEYQATLNSPLANASLLAPFISLIMTMNVFIGPIRYFIPLMAQNLQLFMAPALAVWGVLWFALLCFEIKLLKISFQQGFDVNKISFGWLLHPFALGMLTVVGMGLAAMAQNQDIANVSAFLSLVSGSMGLFLLSVKLIMIFKSHFSQDGLPERQFLPSFLVVIPNLTLYSISAFRFGHFLEHIHGFEMGAYYLVVITLAFAFETWYLAFGLVLLGDYFRKHFLEKEFYVTQWGFICPLVAYAVLGSFMYQIFVPSPFLYAALGVVMILSAGLYFMLLKRHISCALSEELSQDKVPEGSKGMICLE
jgi:hypothetical protein